MCSYAVHYVYFRIHKNNFNLQMDELETRADGNQLTLRVDTCRQKLTADCNSECQLLLISTSNRRTAHL